MSTITVCSSKVPLAERDNMLYINTTVTRGRAEMVVTATSMETEMGHLADMMAEAEVASTPLQIQLDGLGKRLATIAGVVVGLVANQPLELAGALVINAADKEARHHPPLAGHPSNKSRWSLGGIYCGHRCVNSAYMPDDFDTVPPTTHP